MNNFKLFLLLLFCSLSAAQGQQNSVLAEGKWIKMGFDEAGVYRITWSKLREMGFEPSEVDPRNLAIYGNPGGMLPQSLSESRPIDLIENHILVSGENDGVFNENDFILFYVDDVNKTIYDPTSDSFTIEKNLYAEEIFYFLTEKPTNGLRLEQSPDLGANFPEIDHSRELIFHELDETNLLTSGREWLGEQLNSINTIRFEHEISQLKTNSAIKLYSSFIAQAFNSTSLNISLNGTDLGNLNFQAIPNSQYAIKGNIQENQFELNSNLVGNNSLNLLFTFNRNGSNNAVAYLNRYLIDLPTIPAFQGDQKALHFTPAPIDISTFRINTTSDQMQIWDISNPAEIKAQAYSLINNQATFGAFSDQITKYQLFIVNNLPEPREFEIIQNQNLRGSEAAEFIIISHPQFMLEAQRLANFRQMHDNMSVQVVTTKHIYNEFSSGRQDISAIRDYLKLKYDDGAVLKYVLLFGKGSYDYKERIENNSNFVPTYESRNSIHPLLTFSSDDFFGFLDNDEGYWEETRNGDHSLNIGIGRIPARTIAQAKKAVDKIILYQTDDRTLGDWRSKLLFVADDGDRNIHQRDANQLATLVDTTHQQFQVRKLFLDSFEQERLPNGEFSEDAEQALIEAVNEGRLIINFTGHGAEFGWMQERILTFDLMDEWQNTFKLPFLITATCEFGRNDDPNTESGAERLIFKNTGGAIGLLTTTRPVFSSTNYRLNEALYGTMLDQQNGEYQRLGEVIQYTKNNSLQGSLNRNFILLGDPSMQLAYPKKEIQFTEINGKSPDIQDTLRALQSVNIKGVIRSGNVIDSQFNGELDFTFFDKSRSKSTRGSENEPFNFTERDLILFRGKATVSAGQFEIDLTIPKNINYSFGSGKMLAYAIENNSATDALGSSLDFTLGGTYESLTADNTPPEIRIFLNDTLSNISGSYGQDVNAIIKFSDDSGINISDIVLGQNLSLTLNDTLNINLNNRYIGELNSFNKGIVEIELTNLQEGINEILVSARDIQGNSTTKMIEFNVVTKSSFITEIKAYPNPFINEAFFSVSHDLEGENIEINIEILNSRGQPVQILTGEILSAETPLVTNWNGRDHNNQKLQAGIYFYTFRIVSKTTGKSDFVRRKLIISN